MVDRHSEMSLSIFEDISMETVQDNNVSYSVEAQGIYRTKTSTFMELCTTIISKQINTHNNNNINITYLLHYLH